MASFQQQSGTLFNALTAGSKITGNISADTDFRIDGQIIGDVRCNGKLVIGEQGSIKGTIICQNAEIMGFVEGKISAQQSLSLRATGKIIGEVYTTSLIIEPKAIFNGTCSMNNEKTDEN